MDRGEADSSIVCPVVSQEEEREMKYRRYYQRVLKDRLTALRKVRHAVFCRVRHWCRLEYEMKVRTVYSDLHGGGTATCGMLKCVE